MTWVRRMLAMLFACVLIAMLLICALLMGIGFAIREFARLIVGG